MHVPRTVLEWRVAPTSQWRNPVLDDARLIVVCDHGYSSVLAAGLPVGSPGPTPDGLPGMGPLD